MKTFDFLDDVRKETAKKGTGSYPICFMLEDGTVLRPTGNYKTMTDSSNKYDGVTMVYVEVVK